MENVNRLRYDKDEVMDAESDVSFTLKQTISQGLNDGGVLRFRIPADSERFTELNTILLSLTVSLVNPDETEPDFTKVSAILDPQGMHSLFSTVEVRFNENVVSSMTSYPFTTALSRYLGCSREMRVGAWDELDGTWECQELISNMSGQEFNLTQKVQMNKIKKSCTLIGRIYSDVLMSCRQYLPPGVTLGINLRRAADTFSLLTTKDEKLKIKIESASVYVKRLKLRADVMNRALSSLRQGHGLTFNRLECRMMTIPSGSAAFSWLNCLNNAALPNRIYVAFVSPSAYYGSITQIGTYFETGNLKSMNFRLNGRDLLVEPLSVSFSKGIDDKLKVADSDGRNGFLSVLEVMNRVGDQSGNITQSYESYLRGQLFYAIELGKCGEKSGSSGYLDVELEFGNRGSDMELCILIFSEKTQTVRI